MIFELKLKSMKTSIKTILFTIMLASGLSLKAQEKFTLTIEIEGIKKIQGNVLIMLSNSEDSFLKEGEGYTAEVKGEKIIATYQVSKGEYAFSFFHDKNSNGKFDTNFLGIPKEPYGFSNNARGFMGPPSYEKSKFIIDKDTKVRVSF